MYAKQRENLGFVTFLFLNTINGSQESQAFETRTSKIP